MTLVTTAAGEISLGDIDRLDPPTLARLYAELTGDAVERAPRALVRRQVAAWLAVASDIAEETEPPSRAVRRRTRFDLPPRRRIRRTRPGSLASHLLGLLQRGARFEELMAATGRDVKALNDLLHLLNKRTGWGIEESADGVLRLIVAQKLLRT